MSISCKVRSLARVSYYLEVHFCSLGNHDAWCVETCEFQCGDMIRFASTLRRWGLVALPGVGKQVVLFDFLSPNKHHKCVVVELVILDPR